MSHVEFLSSPFLIAALITFVMIMCFGLGIGVGMRVQRAILAQGIYYGRRADDDREEPIL